MRASLIALFLLLPVASFALGGGCKLPNDTSNDTPTTFPTEGCQPWDCGGLPDDAEQVMCPDEVTLSGPTGECIAHGSECAWKVVSCPETPECEPEDCGEAPSAGNYLCQDDRTIAGPSGRCIKKSGMCQWEIKKCPGGTDICPDADCGPAPTLPNWLCPDGDTVAGPSGVCAKKTNGTCGWEIVQCTGTH